MTFDTLVPETLKEKQQWFASIITRPIDEQSRMNPISPSGIPMEVEAPEYINPSPTLQPHKRIEIYNQQYWWRLLNTLHEICPLLTRLFGYRNFNQQIAIPFLCAHPPDHWSLGHLTPPLPQWIHENYEGEDKLLIDTAARIDDACNTGFTAPHYPALGFGSGNPLETKVYPQPHVYTFKMDFNLFKLREELLKQDPDYWVEHPFPKLDRSKTFHFILYRNLKNIVVWDELSSQEYALFTHFSNGATISEAWEWLEQQEEGVEHLQEWLQKWTLRQWLTETYDAS